MGRARRDFKAEGLMELGPRNDFFVFLDGEMFGKILSERSGVESVEGQYNRLGRARITVEWLEDGEATEETSPA